MRAEMESVIHGRDIEMGRGLVMERAGQWKQGISKRQNYGEVYSLHPLEQDTKDHTKRRVLRRRA